MNSGKPSNSVKHDSCSRALHKSCWAFDRPDGRNPTRKTTMPRKQRFKPSRKPKPMIPNENAAMDRSDGGSAAHNENTPVRESLQVQHPDSLSRTSTQSG